MSFSRLWTRLACDLNSNELMAKTDVLPAKVMFQNRNITDFFKPFANPHPAKRPRYDDSITKLTTPAPEPVRLPSRTLQSAATQTSIVSRPTSQVSTTSSLSPLRSDGSTQYVPDNVPSISEGSSLTPSPVLVSSQRITRNGETVIRNSDEDSDSGVSFADIADLLVGKRSFSKSSPPTEPDLPQLPTDPQRRLNAHSSKGRVTRRSRDAQQPRKPDLAMPKYKFSLQSLVAQAEKDDVAEAETAQACELVGSLNQRRAILEAKGNQNNVDGDIDKQLLASVVEQQGDRSKIDKVMQAIVRTEVLSRRNCWTFFNPNKPRVAQELPRFPDHLLSNSSLSVLIPDRLSDLEASFVSGYLGEVVAKTKVPDELLSWILDASFTDASEDLRRAYVSTLTNAGPQMATTFSSWKIDMLLGRLGASGEALDVEHSVEPLWQPPAQDSKSSPNISWGLDLQNILKLLTGTATWVDASSRIRSLCILCRILLDASVVTERGLLDAAEDSFESLVAAIPDHCFDSESSIVLNVTFSQVKDAQLRLQLLRCIPAISPRLGLLRRRLALASFFDDTSYLDKQLPKLIRFKKITSHLRRPEFTINGDTDYLQLVAMISILDIGLDDGDPPDSGLVPDLENRFNENVDSLADMIKGMVAKIVDSGASHMTRTEAKDGLDAFQARLLYAVRTKPRPKLTLFGSRKDVTGHGRGTEDFMSKFLTKSKPVIEGSVA